jgi:hypothetical protein
MRQNPSRSAVSTLSARMDADLLRNRQDAALGLKRRYDQPPLIRRAPTLSPSPRGDDFNRRLAHAK